MRECLFARTGLRMYWGVDCSCCWVDINDCRDEKVADGNRIESGYFLQIHPLTSIQGRTESWPNVWNGACLAHKEVKKAQWFLLRGVWGTCEKINKLQFKSHYPTWFKLALNSHPQALNYSTLVPYLLTLSNKICKRAITILCRRIWFMLFVSWYSQGRRLDSQEKIQILQFFLMVIKESILRTSYFVAYDVLGV